jgi:hypothetical protein
VIFNPYVFNGSSILLINQIQLENAVERLGR